MFSTSRIATRLGVLTIAGLLVAGCSTATGRTTTGGGVGSSAIQPEARVTYGFQLSCNPQTNMVYGQIDYVDHGTSLSYPAGVAVHGTMPMESVQSYYTMLYNTEGFGQVYLPPPGDVTSCAVLDTAFRALPGAPPAGVQVFHGTYAPQPATAGQGGTFTVTAEATNSQLDCGPGEAAVGITLQGGAYDGYNNGVCTALGNVTVH